MRPVPAWVPWAMIYNPLAEEPEEIEELVGFKVDVGMQ